MMTHSIRRPSLHRLAPLAAILLAACATPHFDVDEAIRFQDGKTRFVAFAQNKTGWILRGVSDVDVRFSVDGQEVAAAVTDERGFAKAIITLEKPAEILAPDLAPGHARVVGELDRDPTERLVKVSPSWPTLISDIVRS